MITSRREKLRAATRDEIKAAARALMAQHGSAGLSVRAVARQMGLSAPAIYHYYASLDDLITALIVDAFNALANALEMARDAHAGQSPLHQLEAVLLAYRHWAVAHPTDFQLIYGSPIPNYHAPREVTVPAVIRGFAIIVGLIEAALQAGDVVPAPPYDAVPELLASHLQAMIARDGYPVSEMTLYMGVVGWTQLHGIIMLELFNHLQSVVGDVDAYYAEQVRCLFHIMGLRSS